MLLAEILNDVRKIVSRPGEMLLRTRLRLTASLRDREVGDIPTRDKPSERHDTRVLRKLPKRVHSDEVGRAKPGFGPSIFMIRTFSTHCAPYPLPKIKKSEGLTVVASLPAHPLFDGDRTATMFVYREMIGDQRIARLAIFDVDDNWALRAARL